MGLINHDAFVSKYSGDNLIDTYMCLADQINLTIYRAVDIDGVLKYTISALFNVYVDHDAQLNNLRPIDQITIKIVTVSEMTEPI